jgi:excinuclease UvrABC ATPase subunit
VHRVVGDVKKEVIDLTGFSNSHHKNKKHFLLLIDRVISDDKNRSRLAEALHVSIGGGPFFSPPGEEWTDGGFDP